MRDDAPDGSRVRIGWLPSQVRQGSGEAHHMLARADDATRQAYLEATGERFIRVTWLQATTQPLKTRARIEAALQSGVL